MVSKRIDIQVTGKDDTSKAFNSASKNVSKLGTDTAKAGQTIGSSLTKGASTGTSALNKLGTVGGVVGGKIGTTISKGAQTASNAISKLGTTASQTFSKISSGASKAGQSMDSISGGIAAIAGGYGIMQVAQDAWTGATQREFNQAYLATKMSTEQASAYVGQINQIASVVPGDDTFLNQVLTGALAKQTNLSYQEMMNLGTGLADYMSVSQAMGKSQIETQMDLKEYISTGNTTQLERDSILKNQMETLEGQATVSERILALNKALADEGYSGLSKLDIASIKWQNVLGMIQLSITNIGSAILQFIEPALDLFLAIDKATGGMSTTIGVVLGVVALLGIGFMGLLPILGSVLEGAGALIAILGIGLGPIALIIIGITAAIAAGIAIWSIWGDKIQETIGFLQSGNWGGVATNIGRAFGLIKDYVVNAISQIPAAIGNLSGMMVQLGYQMVHWITDGLTNLSGYLDIVLNSLAGTTNADGAGKDVGNKLMTGLEKWISDNGPTIAKSLVTEFTQMIPLMFRVGQQVGTILLMAIWNSIKTINIGSLLSQMFSGASAGAGSLGSGISSAIMNTIASIPSKIGSMASTFVSMGYQLIHWIVDGLESVSTNIDGILTGILTSIDGGSGGGGSGSSSGAGGAATKTGENIGEKLINGISNWITANGPTIQKGITVIFTRLLPLVGQIAIKLGMIVVAYIGRGLMSLGGKVLNWVLAPFRRAATGIQNAWNLAMLYLRMKANQAVQWVVTRWNWLKAVWNSVTGPIVSAWNWAMAMLQNTASMAVQFVITRWNWLKAIVSVPIQTAINVITDSIDWAKQKWQELKDFVKPITQTITTVYNSIMGGGPGGPARGPSNNVVGSSMQYARGPFDNMGFKYVGYAGHKEGYPKMEGNTMIGNCVDMSLGMMALNGGRGNIVQGTWNGGPHVWYQSPNGTNYDGARKALNNTFVPPAKGPSSNGGDIVINGDVYGWDDFQKKVEKGMDRYMGRLM